ncbi:trace amine-associated receptor 13c-like [Strongylocentrotus purpuratus]|uniref:G-protein coupled receptors family 1 profile domain-containing protein n=1 Tax=Strongylocentrotus purpuratus TaxID=7668 RepID=A0A7M7PQH0_STRPU|nr:trace amine-associated receptor 13c-like [Strongylocentrotus purpuratus]
MAGAKIQNVSEPTYYLTMSFEDYFATSTEDLSETTITEQKTRSVNIHGILWPILFTVLIIVANFLSLVAFCVEKRLRTYNNYFIINLTILDFITGLVQIPAVVQTHIGCYPFSQNICKVHSAIRWGILNSSNLAVVLICADRHRATYDPINHFMSRSKRMAVIKNLIPWTVLVVFWFLIVTKIQATLGGKNVENQFALKDANKGKITAELPHDDMTSAVSTATINVDLSSDSFDQGPKMKNDNAAKSGKKTTMKRETATEMSKATRTLLVIVIAFVVSWLPLSILSLIYSIEPVLAVPGLPRPARLFFGWMPYLNSLLNPISYAVSQPLFRSTIFNMFLCRRK